MCQPSAERPSKLTRPILRNVIESPKKNTITGSPQPLHRVDDGTGPREKLFVPVQESLVRLVPESAVQGARIAPWMQLDLPAALQQWAQHHDQPLRRSAEHVATASLPKPKLAQGWRFHPWLGFDKE